MKSQNPQSPRRRFLKRALGLTLGLCSGATGLFAVLKGRDIEPFLPRDSGSVLKRFGVGRDLLEAIVVPLPTQKEYALRIQKLKKGFDAKSSYFKSGDFARSLRRAVKKDFRDARVVVVNEWILSETEIGIFVYNDLSRRRLI
jgi:hypothetical protein